MNHPKSDMNHILASLGRKAVDADAVVPLLLPTTSFHVETVADACVKTFAHLLSSLTGQKLKEISTKDALLSFFDERLFTINGATPPLWDPVSGDYPIGDEWIRLHCNFSNHRHTALTALGIPIEQHASATREQVLANISKFPTAKSLEEAVESLGGCASTMTSMESWKSSPLYNNLTKSPLLSITPPSTKTTIRWTPPTNPNSPPLTNLQILDLTRVLAGPLCCKTLASQGASIIHISSPTLPNLGPLDLCTLVGKKSLHIDLKTPTGRSHFTTLLRNADVLVQSYRPDALHNLGFSPTELFTINPRLIITNISAYGIPTPTAATTFTNPWKARRGFDSLVQMATGICHESSKTGAPVPLPCQALDHATGWLAACGILEAVQRGFGGVSVDVSLVRTSVWLESLGRKEVVNMVDDAWKKELFSSAEMEEVVVRGVEGKVLRHVKCPVASVDGARQVMGPPDRLGLDEEVTWESF